MKAVGARLPRYDGVGHVTGRTQYVDDVRVGVSGIGPAAVRCRSVEQSRNADEVSKDVDPVDDAVATADYRRRMLVVLVRRALDELESS